MFLERDARFLNVLLVRIGLLRAGVPWLASYPRGTLISLAIWQAGWGMVILLAGLGTNPEELIDAARVDGASYPQRLRRVSLPLLSPFPTVRAMNVLTTSTPPETTFVMMRALFLAISQGRIGYGLGLVWMLLAAVILFTILLLRLGKARVPSNARPVYSAP